MKRKLLSSLAILIVVINFTILAMSIRFSFLRNIQVITHFLTLFSLFYLMAQYLLPLIVYSSSQKVIMEKNRVVESSGKVLEEVTCGGKIKGINFNGPILRIILYPSGFIIKPILMPAISILLNEIIRIESGKVMMTNSTIIHHSSSIIASPLMLFLPKTSSIVIKMEEIKSKLAEKTDELM